MRKAFICPTKYVQGEDEILNLGYFVKTFGESALLIAHPDDVERVKEKTEEIAARMGRAGTVGERSIGYPDAGAYALGVIFTELSKAMVEK